MRRGWSMTSPHRDSRPQGGGRRGPQRVLDRLLVLRLAEHEARQQEVIWVDEIFFAFQGSKAARKLVGAHWAQGNEFQGGWVYVRTEAGVFATTFRTIKDFRRHLHGHFEPVNRGILVNMHHVGWTELFRERRKTLGFYFSDEDTGRNREWVVLSRRGARRVREWLAAPARVRPKVSASRPKTSVKRPLPVPKLAFLCEYTQRGGDKTWSSSTDRTTQPAHGR